MTHSWSSQEVQSLAASENVLVFDVRLRKEGRLGKCLENGGFT